MKTSLLKLTVCVAITTLIHNCNRSKTESAKDYLEKDSNEMNIDKSIDYCTTAIKIDSTYIDAYYRRASLYISLARGIQTMIDNGSETKGSDLTYFEKGINDYNKILLIDKKESKAQSLKAFAYLYQGDTTTACLEFNKALLLGEEDVAKKIKEVCN